MTIIGDLKGMRILAVEDAMMAAPMLETLLGDSGYTVVGSVGSVAKALTLLESEPVDGALLDVNVGGEFVHPASPRPQAAGGNPNGRKTRRSDTRPIQGA